MTFTSITDEQIEDWFYQISILANKVQAKRFKKLSRSTKQKVVYVLVRRERIARKIDLHIDLFTIREVIDDAQKGNYIDLGIF